MKRLVIIDGKSVFYRGYYAMGALSTSDGVPTGGVYGFAAIAMELVRQLDPTKVVVAWDSKSSTAKRKALYPEYKAGRVKPGEDFYAQIPYLEELVRALGWGFMECADYEADDIIGTLALQADEETALACSSSSTDARLARRTQSTARSDAPVSLNNIATVASSELKRASDSLRISSEISAGVDSKAAEGSCEKWETFIVSSDLDMLQIVDENTRMYRILKGFSKLEELDVAAVEAKYGIKKSQFLDLKALKGDASDNIPGVPGIGEKTAAKLLGEFGTLEGVYEHLEEITGTTRQKLETGRESAFMSYQLAKIMTDAPVRLEDVPDLEINRERILAALDKLEFRSLKRKFFQSREPRKSVEVPKNESLLGEENVGVEGVENGALNGSGNGTKNASSEGQNAVKGAQQAMRDEQGLESRGTAVQTKHSRKSDSGWSQPTLETPVYVDGVLVSWDVKGLMHKNAQVATEVLQGKKFWDLGQGAFLLNPLRREVDQGDERQEYERQRKEFTEVAVLEAVYKKFDQPLIPVLYKMEEYGMLLDLAHFKRLREEFEGEVAKLEERVWELAGRQFNVNSPVQLADVLFNTLGLPTKGVKKTARGYSTGVKELDKLEGTHEIIGAVKEYREAAKLLSTYIVPLPELADLSGRIHTTFNQNVTATGRLSSTNPNLQNIPVRTEVGKRIREGFIAPEGRVLVSADYSQFELRLAAALANDEALTEDFNQDIDIHTKTAAEAFGVSITEVTKTQRRAAKVINFGVLYGMSAKGLADAAGMNITEAKEFIDRYFELRKPIKVLLEEILGEARERGYVQTLFGRRRPTPDVRSSNFLVRAAAERAAQNMPIQGTEADLMKLAMLKVDKRLGEEMPDAKLVMQVHDSLIVECSEGDAERVGEVLKTEMEGVMPELKVKLAVDVTIGKNWGEL